MLGLIHHWVALAVVLDHCLVQNRAEIQLRN